MRHEKKEVFKAVKDLLDSQMTGVLGTYGSGGPYCSLVGFSAEEDLRRLYFVTTRATRKYSNLVETGSAALLVDNRGKREDDIHEASAVTATGPVRDLAGADLERAVLIHIAKNPFLADFTASPSSALLALDVESYFLVRRFQQVTILEMTK
jgi:nitroimidazol reductase NimA-like FMN-containing flavoprotein (pyridoxamine 5'-phosphate oxidase superfamily)